MQRPLNRLCSGVTDAGRCLRQLASVYRLVPLLVVVAMTAGSVRAHDASSYGGVFRSRNLGGTWLRADVGLFLNAALVVPSIRKMGRICWRAPISGCSARVMAD